MKVFISWSGETSNKIAEVIKNWLPNCLQTVEVFCSSSDIEKGENWNAKLSGELESTNFGIVVLTDDNIIAPWLHFEAGALSKKLGSKVCAIATNIEIVDIKGPLASFQACKFTKEDFKKMLVSINSSNETKINDNVLNKTFDAFWSQLESEIKTILGQKKNTISEKKQKLNQNDAIEELIQLTRMISGKMYLLNELTERLNGIPLYEQNNYSEMDMNEIYEFSKYLMFDFAKYLDSTSRNNLFNSIEIFLNNISKDSKKWNARFRILLRRASSSKMNSDNLLSNSDEV
ncbi:MAG: TIR domain-containing protein [Acholeplasma sp.]|nr:TIR domain-containing protein [Acholeplasma sp.]